MPRTTVFLTLLCTTPWTGGCSILEPDDIPAPVQWLEARFEAGRMHIRAIGSSGCGQLTSLNADVHFEGRVAVVHVFARASDPDFQCFVSFYYDTTVSITTPGTRGGIVMSASRAGVRSDLFTIPATRHKIDAWVGGTAEVELAPDCPHIRLGPGQPTDVVYAIELPRDVELRDGDWITLSGTLPEATPSSCSSEPLLRVDRLVL